MVTMFDEIQSNCRRFAQGRLTEQKLTERNADNCHLIESQMVQERRDCHRKSDLARELTRAFWSTYIFVSPVRSRLCVFVALSGFKN